MGSLALKVFARWPLAQKGPTKTSVVLITKMIQKIDLHCVMIVSYIPMMIMEAAQPLGHGCAVCKMQRCAVPRLLSRSKF
jgi:hypothetical protein